MMLSPGQGLNFLILAISLVRIMFSSSIVQAIAAGDENMLDVMKSVPDFSLMVILVDRIHQNALFQDERTKRMVFVPNDFAFLGTNTDLIIHFLTDPSWKFHLRHFLKYHMLSKIVDVRDGSVTVIETLVDESITVQSYLDGGTLVNSAAGYVGETIMVSNGAIQAIDNVLVTAWQNSNIADVLESDPIRFSMMTGIGKKDVNFVSAISSTPWEPFTIFVPTNEAFSESQIFETMNINDVNLLCYHLVPGIHTGADLMHVSYLKSLTGQLLQVDVDSNLRTMRINGNLVIQSNILANNGVIHVIDGPLVPALNDESEISTQYTGHYQTDDRCGCSSSCPAPCAAWVQWLKNSEGYDKSTACSELQRKCTPPLVDPNTMETLLQEDEHNMCLFSKEIEEARGASEVECSCRQKDIGADTISFDLECTKGTNTVCAPKYGECDSSEDCCSSPLRRCVGGQCRDARRPRTSSRKRGGA